jgi:uncharacterized membrane protein (DUF4010 family)
MLTVMVLVALLGAVSQLLHIQTGSRIAAGFPISVAVLLVAALFYSGRARFRVAFGMLLLIGAMAIFFVGLIPAVDGVKTAWFFPVISGVLAYCCWVILVSKSARQFLGENRQRFQNARTSSIPPLSGHRTDTRNV